MELDHIFICTAPGAPSADALRAFGLTEGPPNRHPGQGTANRRFFFRRSFIELVYQASEDELRSAQTRPTMLYERLARPRPDVSPFGIGLRPRPGAAGSVPFSSWPYTPDYLPDGQSIPIGHAPVSVSKRAQRRSAVSHLTTAERTRPVTFAPRSRSSSRGRSLCRTAPAAPP